MPVPGMTRRRQIINTEQLVGGVSTANAFNVDLQAPTINIETGAKILAQAVNFGGTSYTSGNITLDATSSPTGAVTVAGLLIGGTVTLEAGSSITLSSGAVINTQQLVGGYSTANAYNVELQAPTINVAGAGNGQSAAQILAQAVNSGGTHIRRVPSHSMPRVRRPVRSRLAAICMAATSR